MNTKWKLILQTVITAVALILVLAYNFMHTGALLASYVAPWWIGYVAALGIELAVVGLSLQIGRRRNNKQDTGFFYFVLIAVVFVSALANMSQGHAQRYGTEITIDAVSAIDWIQLVVGIAATALLSLIVMAMAEIVGQFMEQPDAQAAQGDAHDAQVDATVTQTYTQQAQAMAKADPTLTRGELAALIGCSLSTVNRALAHNNGREPKRTKEAIER